MNKEPPLRGPFSFLMGEVWTHGEVGSTEAPRRVASVTRRRDQLSGVSREGHPTPATTQMAFCVQPVRKPRFYEAFCVFGHIREKEDLLRDAQHAIVSR